MAEMLCNSRLKKLKHVPESEVNFFIRGIYELWISKGEGSMPVVELKERFGDLMMNIYSGENGGRKALFSTGVCKDEESRRFQKALGDFMHLVGLIMVSEAFPLFGWIDSLTGYKGKMKKTSKDMDQILESRMKEHQQKRKHSSIDELEQDFMHVMLNVMESDPSAQISNNGIKGTCLNGSTLDPLPHLNQVVANVGDWDAWPQSKQNIADKDVEIAHKDGNVEDEGENLEDAFENVVVSNEVGNEVVNEVGNQVAEGGHEVAEDGTGVPNVVVEDSEDATMSER